MRPSPALPAFAALSLLSLASGRLGAECVLLSDPQTRAGCVFVWSGRSSNPLEIGLLNEDPTVGIRQDGMEFRNWLEIPVPAYAGRLLRAEIWVWASHVDLPEGPAHLQFRRVGVSVSDLQNGTGDRVASYADLGDGPILAEGIIRSEDGVHNTQNGWGSQVALPLTAEGLAAIQVARGRHLVLGGSLVRPADGSPAAGVALADRLGQPVIARLMLITDEDGSGTSEIQADTASFLAGGPLSLGARACVEGALSVQWAREGIPIPGATNLLLRLHSATAADTGRYTLRTHLPAGTLSESAPVTVSVNPFAVLSGIGGVRQFVEFQSSFLDVTVSSHLPIQYQWRRNGLTIPDATGSFLPLRNLQRSDSGLYEVEVRNAAGSTNLGALELTVLPLPLEGIEPNRTDFVELAGSRFVLPSNVRGSPPMTFQWFRDGQPLPGATSQDLLFENLSPTHHGEYHVVASNAFGSVTGRHVRLTVKPLDLSGAIGAHRIWELGRPAHLFAQSASVAPVSYQWIHNDVPIVHATHAWLTLQAVSESDAGEYSIVGSNNFGVVTALVATITVAASPPAVSISSHSAPVEGESLALNASVFGAPPPHLQWFRNNLPLAGQTNEVLLIPNVSATHAGSYVVSATNALGDHQSIPYVVEISGSAPRFSQTDSRLSAREGTTALLSVPAYGSPLPTFHWRRNNRLLFETSQSLLAIPAITRADAGSYEVVASNRFGAVSNLITLEVNASTSLDRWEWRHPLPQGSRLEAIAYGNGRLVAVAKGGHVLVSSNLTDWMVSQVEPNVAEAQLIFGNGRFLLLSPPNTDAYFHLTSADGVTWTNTQPSASSDIRAAFGDGRFVGVSRTDTYHSTDGLSWSRHPLQSRVPDLPVGLVWGGGLFLLTTQGGNLLRSNGDEPWQSIATPLPLSGGRNLGFLGDRYYLVTQYGGALVSIDAQTWVDHPGPARRYADSASGNGVSVVISSERAAVDVSTDGVNWNTVDTGIRQDIASVLHADGRFVVVGGAGSIAMSADGLRWGPDLVSNDEDFFGVAHGMDVTVVVGERGSILTSTNGRSWVTRTPPSSTYMRDVHFAKGLFVAAGNGGTLFKSSNGVDWQRQRLGSPLDFLRVHFADDRWVVVGEGGIIATSTDGSAWEVRNSGYLTYAPTDHEGVAYGNGRWVVAGGYLAGNAVFGPGGAQPTLLTSQDGLNWSSQFRLRPDGAGQFDGKRLRDVAFGNGLFVAVGNDGLVLTSRDGLEWWWSRGGTPNLRRVQWIQGRWIAMGNDGALVSTSDPVRGPWTRHASRHSQNLHDFERQNDGTLIAVGNNGMILQSAPVQPRVEIVHASEGGVDLRIDSGLHPEGVYLQSSADLLTWATDTVLTFGTTHVPIPIHGHQFFRARAP